MVQALCELIQGMCETPRLGPDLHAPSGTGWNRGFHSVLLGRFGIFHCSLIISRLFYPELFPSWERGSWSALPPGAGGNGGGQTHRVPPAPRAALEAGSHCVESGDQGKREGDS